MRGRRVAFSAILAVGLLASGATSVSANDTPTEETIPPGPGLVELKQAIADFRAALVVQPGDIAEFRFSVRAPLSRGVYRLNLRPVIDGTTWMDHQGVFWIIDVP